MGPSSQAQEEEEEMVELTQTAWDRDGDLEATQVGRGDYGEATQVPQSGTVLEELTQPPSPTQPPQPASRRETRVSRRAGMDWVQAL